jgi:hypothetical protein
MKTIQTAFFAPLLALAACSSQNVVNMPEGPKPNSKTWETPKDVPTIDLSEDNVPDFWTATPTIIDTTTFKDKHQVKGFVEGEHPRPAAFLPKHKKPKFEEVGPPNRLVAGGGISNTSMHNLGGFDAIPNTAWNPPDPSIAVGPDHIVATVNMAIAFYDKDGNEEFSALLDDSGNPGFFEDVGAGGFTFDPKCFYDQHSQRFVVLALEYYDNESWITIAVSDDSDPNGVWYKYRTWSVVSDGSSNYWVDYPGLGFDDNYFYVTGNLFGLNYVGWGGVLYRVFDKTPMLSGDPVVIADVRRGGHASMQCTQHYGDAPSAFFVGRKNSTELRLAHINNPSNPSVVSEIVAVPNHSTPGNVSNPGGSISALDGRIMNAHYRDGSLWTAHGIEGSGVDAVGRWYEIDLSDWPSSSASLRQSGDTAVPNSMSSFFPAIAQNKRGEVAVVVATANNSTNPTLQILGRKSGDLLGTMGSSTIVRTGNSGADGRWGDYFDMTVDPNNDTIFWYIGEVQTNSGWQTYIGSALITCLEDINADGDINVTDILALISNWGTGGDGAEVAAPYDVIDVSDVLGIIGALGECP